MDIGRYNNGDYIEETPSVCDKYKESVNVGVSI